MSGRAQEAQDLTLETLDADTLQVEAVIRSLGVVIHQLQGIPDVSEVLSQSHRQVYGDLGSHREELRLLTVTAEVEVQLSAWYQQYPILEAALEVLGVTEQDDAAIWNLHQAVQQSVTRYAERGEGLTEELLGEPAGMEEYIESAQANVKAWQQKLVEHFLPWAMASFRHMGFARQNTLYLLTHIVRHVFDPNFGATGLIRAANFLRDNCTLRKTTPAEIIELYVQLIEETQTEAGGASSDLLQWFDQLVVSLWPKLGDMLLNADLHEALIRMAKPARVIAPVDDMSLGGLFYMADLFDHVVEFWKITEDLEHKDGKGLTLNECMDLVLSFLEAVAADEAAGNYEYELDARQKGGDDYDKYFGRFMEALQIQLSTTDDFHLAKTKALQAALEDDEDDISE